MFRLQYGAPALHCTTNEAIKYFLISLSESCPVSNPHPAAEFFKLYYKETKNTLCRELIKLYNRELFENKLSNLMKLTWSDRFMTLAGKTHCLGKKHSIVRDVKIELGTRVVDRPERLRDTLLHEMCHAATWVEYRKLRHGATWKSYAARARKRFPYIPPVRTRHSYKLAYKYTFKCVACSRLFHRCYKRVKMLKSCKFCNKRLKLIVNDEKSSDKIEVPELCPIKKKPRKRNKFALFVKGNYKRIKETGGKSHGEIMTILSQEYMVGKPQVLKFRPIKKKRKPNQFPLFVKRNYKKVKETEGKTHGEVMKILGEQFKSCKK